MDCDSINCVLSGCKTSIKKMCRSGVTPGVCQRAYLRALLSVGPCLRAIPYDFPCGDNRISSLASYPFHSDAAAWRLRQPILADFWAHLEARKCLTQRCDSDRNQIKWGVETLFQGSGSSGVAMDILRKQNSGSAKLGQQEDSLLWSNSWTWELGVSHSIVRSVNAG